MKITVKQAYQKNLEKLINFLESIEDTRFDMREPSVNLDNPLSCGCVEAWAGVLWPTRVIKECDPLVTHLGLSFEERDYIFYARFSEDLYDATRQEAIDFLKSLRNNSVKE